MKAALSLLVSAIVVSSGAVAQDMSDPFYTAIRENALPDLRRLIQTAGANTSDKRGTTPLMDSAAVGSLDAMKLLVAAGADVNAKNQLEITALMWCATDLKKVRFLLSKGADPNARSKQGQTPLLIAASTDGNLETVKLLLEKGANLKKADADPASTPLSAAAQANDLAMFRFLLERGAIARGPAGGLSLGFAAAHGNAAMVRLLLEQGVSPNMPSPPPVLEVKNGTVELGSFTPLILASSFGGPETVKILLDAKANVNAQEARGMTPLMFSVAVDHPDARVVRLLLDRGADPKIKSKSGETAIDWARKFDNPEVMKALGLTPAVRNVLEMKEPAFNLQQASAKSVELLQRTAGNFFMEGGCPSCHSHNVAALAFERARQAGIQLDDVKVSAVAQQTKASWALQDQLLMLRIDAPGGHNMVAYGVFELVSRRAEPSRASDAMVHNIAALQQTDGSWHRDGIARPPMADGDFTHTALAIRSLERFGAPGRREEFDERIARGAAWLRKNSPLTTEDRTMQLLGRKWAGDDTKALGALTDRLAALQRADGGWGQTETLPGDAYATGQSLYALREAGMPTTGAVYRKGIDFLLRTQQADGSWHVVSRSPKFQPYFQSGFPYDDDQWISMAGTSWAAAALCAALPPAKMKVAVR